jgi:tetratricopeptide (TPR) repeat protein
MTAGATQTGKASRPGATAAILAVVAVGLAVADRFLAKIEASETSASAKRSYDKGSRLLEQGNTTGAVDFLREAHGLDRQNPQYSLRLVSALSASGRTSDAAPLLQSLLQREPNDGEANLEAARLAVKSGNLTEAQAYYHRAIYGEWQGNVNRQRNDARMELVNLLVEKNRKQELLAELIELEAQPGASTGTQKRIAELFLFAEAPARAAAIYRSLADADPRDIAANEGLGNAELQLGQYRAAHDAYQRAFMQAPNNTSVRAHLQVLNTVTGLDPTLRTLTSAEKYRRSVRILQMARESLERCGEVGHEELLKVADDQMGSAIPPHVTNEDAEGVLAIAEKLWQAEQQCDGAKATDMNPLALVMRKVAS